MRTNIEIDDKLMARAMELTGLRTKRAVVDAALRELVEHCSRQKLREAFGKYPWEGVSTACADARNGHRSDRRR